MNDQLTVPQQTAMPALWTPRDQFELEQRQAKAYMQSTLVPKEYQDNLSNCLIAMNMAKRIGADPLMVMQNLYIVHGRPGWSAQFLIATFNQSNRFSALRFETKGDDPTKKDYACRAWATEKATGEKIVGSWIAWPLVDAEGWSKKPGSKWLTMPAQMFMYRAAAWLIRTHAPELAMGLPTAEELGDIIDVTPEREAPVNAIDKAKADIAAALNPVSEAPKVDPATGELLPAA